jgi:bifunctional UDP-N-acetylglucosamine pyrophosphorylase / glucosamine-1-phosphate N-acetyltransferase
MQNSKRKHFTAIVLAAGKGVRMKSDLPKVLNELCGQPMIYYVLKEIAKLKGRVNQIIVVVGSGASQVKEYLSGAFPGTEFALQSQQLGTAHAVKCALGKVKQPDILLLCADAPLVKAQTLAKMMDEHLKQQCAVSLLTSQCADSPDLGRLLRDDSGNVRAIVEKEGFSDGIPSLEVNSGMYCFETAALKGALKQVKPNPIKGEYFLTDVLGIFYQAGRPAKAHQTDFDQIMGINSQNQLAKAASIMRSRINEAFMEAGVRFIDPGTTFVDEGVKVGSGSVIYPFTFIEKDVRIGRNCVLGPFIRLRKGTRIADNTHLGNFVEISRCTIGKNVRAKHFCFLGDAVVGNNVNIGAGTVAANYDGKNKHQTHIGRGAFIGSDSILVAPIRIGKAALTGAGSVVTHSVKAGTTVIGVPARPFKKCLK